MTDAPESEGLIPGPHGPDLVDMGYLSLPGDVQKAAEVGLGFLTGVQNGWHAIDSAPFGAAAECGEHAWALCGAIVRVAGAKYQPYDPYGYPVLHDRCPACFWTVAAGSGTLDAAVARLADPSGGRCLEQEITAAIVAQHRAGEEHDPAGAAVIQLLAAVSAHAPVALLCEACSEGECDHEGSCPSRTACRACSLQDGSWAGEWQGGFRDECTIEAPCAVLLALAASAGVKA